MAREIDEKFYRELTDSRQPIPDWLCEHLENRYPNVEATVAEIEAEAKKLRRKVRTQVFYSENIMVAKYLRWSAFRSRYYYLLGNLVAGLFFPVLPEAKKENAYRAIVLAEFIND